jgi:hypothetical protein
VTALATLGIWDGGAVSFAVDPPAPGIAVLVQAADGHMLGAAAISER